MPSFDWIIFYSIKSRPPGWSKRKSTAAFVESWSKRPCAGMDQAAEPASARLIVAGQLSRHEDPLPRERPYVAQLLAFGGSC